MNPAFSVILFTAVSGVGLGVWWWLGLRIAVGGPAGPYESIGWAIGLLGAGVLVAMGLVSSFFHLGKPQRAWRAFSQWRTSWLSREGALAIACFATVVLVFIAGSGGFHPAWLRVSGALLAVLALATVYCTAMIYASLTPIPAWRHRLVPAIYLGFALLPGLLLLPTFAVPGVDTPWLLAGMAMLASALAAMKLRYWRDIDQDPLPRSRGDAIGLPQRSVSVFERPHTEANFITREMAFVVARRHAHVLRLAALLLFAVLPLLLVALAWLQPHAAIWSLPLAAGACLLGAMLERWLFFAQARHVVTLYY